MQRKERIEQQLVQELAPVFLSVENESNNHHVPKGSETHFKVIAVSAQFAPSPLQPPSTGYSQGGVDRGEGVSQWREGVLPKIQEGR